MASGEALDIQVPRHEGRAQTEDIQLAWMASRFPFYPTVFQSLTLLSQNLLQARLHHPDPRVPSCPQREASSCRHVGGSTALFTGQADMGEDGQKQDRLQYKEKKPFSRV